MRMMVLLKNILNSKNIRNGAIYTIFSFLNRGLGFILLLILAGCLNPSDYGSLNLFNTFITLVGIFITLGTTGYVSVAFFQKDRESLNRIIGLSLFVTSIVLIMLSLILLIVPYEVQRITGIGLNYLFVALLICYTSEISNLNLVLWQVEEKPLSYGVFTFILAIFNFIFTLWFIVGLKMNWEGRVYSQLIVSLSLGIYSIYFIIKHNYISFLFLKKSIVIDTLSYGIPMIPHLMSFWFKQGCDRYVIQYYWDASYVGVYSFALNFAAIINMIGTAFNSSNSVYIFKNLSLGYVVTKGVLMRITHVMTWVYLVLTLTVWSCSSLLIPIILPKYVTCIPLLLPICIGAFAQCLYLLWVNYLFYYKRTKQLMYITFSTAILQLIISIILTGFTIIYTAYISMSISIITFGLVAWYAKRTINYNITDKEV